MSVLNQLSVFLGFFVIGVIIAIIFDFFRTYRKIKRSPTSFVILQDIIFFLLATIVIFIGIITILDTSIRLYVFIAIICGCVFHFTFFSKYTMKGYELLFKTSKKILDFILLPIKLILYIIVKNCINIKKISKKCCKMFFYMITFKQKSLTKRDFKIKQKKVKI